MKRKPKRKRKPRSICACGFLKRGGRCTASPSCDDFKRPGLRRLAFESKLKKQERTPTVIGLSVRQVNAAFEKVDPRYTKARARAAGRARKGWRAR